MTLVTVNYNEGAWTEDRLHARFQQQRVRGEWFKLEGNLAAWLAPAIERGRLLVENGMNG